MRDYNFGNFICKLRLEMGLSQFQLGKLIGVSDKAVSKWENGSAKPRLDTCHQLASVFHISIDELLACKNLKWKNSNYIIAKRLYFYITVSCCIRPESL